MHDERSSPQDRPAGAAETGHVGLVETGDVDLHGSGVYARHPDAASHQRRAHLDCGRHVGALQEPGLGLERNQRGGTAFVSRQPQHAPRRQERLAAEQGEILVPRSTGLGQPANCRSSVRGQVHGSGAARGMAGKLQLRLDKDDAAISGQSGGDRDPADPPADDNDVAVHAEPSVSAVMQTR